MRVGVIFIGILTVLVQPIQVWANAPCGSAVEQIQQPLPGGIASLNMRLVTPIIASDQPIALTLLDQPPGGDLRAAVKVSVAGQAAVAYDLFPISWTKSQDATNKGSDLLLTPIRQADLKGDPFPRYKLLVILCSDKQMLTSAFLTKGQISNRWLALPIAIVFASLVYLLSARALSTGSFWGRLNPIQLATDGSGRASLANMQIIFFSVIVLFIVSYLLLRTGVLANLSTDVLLLLGIAGLGSAAGTVATTNRRRLSFDNWAWSKNKHWTDESGYHVTNPSWRDLFTTDGDFDPYKFQMLGFSFVIGVSLLLIGVGGLSNYTIPQALLGVIGLSQVTYIGGKIVTPSTFGDLDEKLTALRKLETDFLVATAAQWTGPAPPGGDRLAAARAADPADYMKFMAAVEPAWIMFQVLFPANGGKAAVREPSI